MKQRGPSNFKRQVSPGLAAVMVIAVLVVVQYVWYVGLVKKPTTPMGQPKSGGAPPPANKELLLHGKDYIVVDTIAGDLDPGNADGPGYKARFDRPTGLAIDPAGVLIIADSGNNSIRSMRPDGVVTTLAGNGTPGKVDGAASNAQFKYPTGVCVGADGTIYVADTGNNAIRAIKAGQVTTIAVAGKGGIPNGAYSPVSIAFKSDNSHGGTLLVADAAGKAVWELQTGGAVVAKTVLSAAPTSISTNGDAIVCLPLAALLQVGSVQTQNVDIAGSDELDDVKRRPRLSHPLNAMHLGTAVAAVDAAHTCVFLVKNGRAEVLAGLASSAGPAHDYKDGNGEAAFFNQPTGLATDGKRVIYVADTASCCIRRLTAPDFLFH